MSSSSVENVAHCIKDDFYFSNFDMRFAQINSGSSNAKILI